MSEPEAKRILSYVLHLSTSDSDFKVRMNNLKKEFDNIIAVRKEGFKANGFTIPDNPNESILDEPLKQSEINTLMKKYGKSAKEIAEFKKSQKGM